MARSVLYFAVLTVLVRTQKTQQLAGYAASNSNEYLFYDRKHDLENLTTYR